MECDEASAKERESSESIRQRLDALLVERSDLEFQRIDLEASLRKVTERLGQLNGGVYQRGSISAMKNKLKTAIQRELDEKAIQIIFIMANRFSKTVFVKATAKRIVARIAGTSSNYLFHLNGKPVGAYHNADIDIRKTFGIDADELPPRWQKKEE